LGSISREGKKHRLPFPQNGPIRGSKTLEIAVQALKSVSQVLEIIQIGSIFGAPDAPARDESERLGWSIRPSPRIAFFLPKYQNRLRMSGKKWRLPFLLFQSDPSIRSILSVLGYQCCADFAFCRGFRLLRQSDSGSAGSAIPSVLPLHRSGTWPMERKVHGDPIVRNPWTIHKIGYSRLFPYQSCNTPNEFRSSSEYAHNWGPRLDGTFGHAVRQIPSVRPNEHSSQGSSHTPLCRDVGSFLRPFHYHIRNYWANGYDDLLGNCC